jgi:hypothetical protein
MMDVALSIFALIAGGVTMELFAAGKVPMSSQEERGFLLGTQGCVSAEDSQSGNPS